jgi:superfamily II DNA or RNA helicase
MGQLQEALVEALRGTRPRTARQLAAVLGVTSKAVNPVLYGHPDLFEHHETRPPTWSLRREQSSGKLPPPTPGLTRTTRRRQGPDELEGTLYPWQRRAVEAWGENGHRGVVEAVTGAGKTRVGLTAIADAVASGHRVLVVVPTKVLLDQWRGEIERHLRIRAGALGGGSRASLSREQVVVSTVQSASRIDRLLPRSTPGLLVCDEVHRYGADSFARVLQPGFTRRLGMTATFERNDNGLDTYLLPYFEKVVYSLGYREALDEGVIAHFRVAIVRVALSNREQLDYDEAHGAANAARAKLISQFGVTPAPFGEFMAEVVDLADGSSFDPATKTARRFLTSFSESRRILGDTPVKLGVLRHIHEAVASSTGTLVFASTVAGAHRAADVLESLGIPAGALESTMGPQERREVLDRFERGEILAAAAPLVLDEGVDVPEANLAIILAASKTRRQMIQRLGRVVRVKADGGRAHLALLVARDTSEDPSSGAHLGFIDEMLEVADELRLFDPSTIGELATFLAGGAGGTVVERCPVATAGHQERNVVGKQSGLRAPEDYSRLAQLLEDLEAVRPGRSAARPPPAASGREPFRQLPGRVPLSLLLRIRGELSRGPRTAAGLTVDLQQPRTTIMAALGASSEFVQRGLWWHLASLAPEPEPSSSLPATQSSPVASTRSEPPPAPRKGAPSTVSARPALSPSATICGALMENGRLCPVPAVSCRQHRRAQPPKANVQAPPKATAASEPMTVTRWCRHCGARDVPVDHLEACQRRKLKSIRRPHTVPGGRTSQSGMCPACGVLADPFSGFCRCL